MKKLILLFTIVCANQLYGMEPSPWEQLPKELQEKIVNTALATSKSVDDAVNAIKAFGTLHKVHYSTQAATNLLMKTLPNDLHKAINAVKNLQGTTPQDFTKLMHILADKFNTNTLSIASEFINLNLNKTTAQNYIELSKKLLAIMLGKNNIPEAEKLIAEGADILYEPALIYLIIENSILATSLLEKIKFSLDHGADPSVKYKGETALYLLDDYNEYGGAIPEYKQIRPLLKEAIMKKQKK
jgi:hypothetical protein